MNVPGRADGNWSWRCPGDKLSLPAFDWLQELTDRSRRAAPTIDPHLTMESTDLERATASQV